ncbi:MAG: hypothetical protein JWM11_4719, partial [Planctomycetaceae bacterium]|nr:hypothetical protein [Planctomycetaceae bacterium]
MDRRLVRPLSGLTLLERKTYLPRMIALARWQDEINS